MKKIIYLVLITLSISLKSFAENKIPCSQDIVSIAHAKVDEAVKNAISGHSSAQINYCFINLELPGVELQYRLHIKNRHCWFNGSVCVDKYNYWGWTSFNIKLDENCNAAVNSPVIWFDGGASPWDTITAPFANIILSEAALITLLYPELLPKLKIQGLCK